MLKNRIKKIENKLIPKKKKDPTWVDLMKCAYGIDNPERYDFTEFYNVLKEAYPDNK